MGLTWPQVYLLLDGGLYNAPDLEPEANGKTMEGSEPPQTEEEAIRRDLQFAAMFDPTITARTEEFIAEWRAKQERKADGS